MTNATGPAHPQHLDAQRDGGHRTTVSGVHVTIRGSAPVMLALVGWLVDGTPARAVLWITAGLAALASHEFAHAVVVRRAGASPYVELGWRGGLTRWWPREHLPTRLELRALAAGPLVGGAAAIGAGFVSARLTLASGTWAAIGAETAWIFAVVSLAAVALDLLPVFPRDASRALLLVLRGDPVERVVRAATLGAVVAAAATAALAASPLPGLALVPGVLVLTNAWLAVRGDRAIGRPVPEAIEARDWASVRRRILAGCDTPDLAAEAQEHALSISAFEQAADIGDAALARGWHTIGFARRTATARAFLEQDDLAMARVHDAVAFGAHPDDLAREPMLRGMTYRLDWPTVDDDAADASGSAPQFDFFIDLTRRVRA